MTERQEQRARARRRVATARRVERASGALATAALARMEESLPWFRAMPAENRSWIGLVAQAGIAAFVSWLRDPGGGPEIRGEVFGAAPRELTRAVTLQQTVELVRATIDVVEERAGELAADGDEPALHEAILRYSREIAFAAAQVYAAAAEERGAWDARLEALVVDALLRGEGDESLRSRAAALGWSSHSSVAVLTGSPPPGEPEAVVDALHRSARHVGADVLVGVQPDRLVAVIGGDGDLGTTAAALLAEFGPGPAVLGPQMPDLLAAANSAGAAIAGFRCVAAWPGAPRLVHANELLPERAVDGDPQAQRILLEEVYRPLREAGGALVETVAAYLEQGGSLEATARALFVHPNTVRYRLRRCEEISGYLATEPRQGLVLQLALILGRLATSRSDEPTGNGHGL